MALILIEGFETFTTSTGVDISPLLEKRYPDATSTWSSATGRITGLCASVGTSSTLELPFFSPSLTGFVLGFAFKPTTISVTAPLAVCRNSVIGGARTTYIELDLRSTGQLALSGASVTLYSKENLFLNSWHFIELKATIADSGMVEVKLDGKVVIFSSSIDTKAGSLSGITDIELQCAQGGYIDDIYLADLSGPFNNDLLGDNLIYARKPSSDSSVSWTASSLGSNFADVDDIPPDNNDTTYVYASKGGSQDLYSYSNIAGSPTAVDTILGVQLHTSARKTASEKKIIKNLISSGATDVLGQAYYLPTTYVYCSNTYDVDPDTNVYFTVSGLNAAKFGFVLSGYVTKGRSGITLGGSASAYRS